ncbi:hypothetical protein [Dactylosporangium sp. CA-139066]|uniref:hypothetical protein n=1 Tax=Dactylosporangium sp. CA-139066 TaxID=3239930 RepID=UPI003D8BD832
MSTVPHRTRRFVVALALAFAAATALFIGTDPGGFGAAPQQTPPLSMVDPKDTPPEKNPG